MAVYGSMAITQQGQDVYAQAQSGAALTFTSMAIGGGELTTTLSAALASGTAYTSIEVAALTSPVANGQTLTIGAQTITASAAAAIGATSIAVTSFTASANYAIGATVTLVSDPTTLTALLNPIASITISKITVSGNTATVYGVYQNTSLAVSTYTCEIGLFATDPATGNPVLYGYANAGTQGDTFPPASDGAYSRQFAISIAIGSAANVTADTPSLVYGALSQANDWQAEQTFAAGITGTGSVGALTVPFGNLTSVPSFVLTSEVGAASGVASLDATGNVPANELGNVPAVADASATTAGIVKTAATPAASPAAALITNPSGAALQTVAGPLSMQSVAATMTGTSGRFVGATDGAPTAGTYGVGDYADDPTNGCFWICSVAGAPGTWVKASPSSATPSTAGVVEVAAAPSSGAPVAVVANPLAGASQTVAGPLAPTALAPSGLTGAVAASRYAGATASGAPTAGTFAIGDFVIDQTGAVWVCTAAGTPGTWKKAGGSARVYGSLSTNYNTTSTSALSSGFGIAFTPAGTAALIEGMATLFNSNAGDGCAIYVYRNTTGVPAQGTAPGTDTLVMNGNVLLSPTVNAVQKCPIFFEDAGLTPGTEYYYYIAFQAVTGGTATLTGGSIPETTLSANNP